MLDITLPLPYQYKRSLAFFFVYLVLTMGDTFYFRFNRSVEHTMKMQIIFFSPLKNELSFNQIKSWCWYLYFYLDNPSLVQTSRNLKMQK